MCITKQAEEILRYLQGVVPAFESASIGSHDYRDKALLVHKNVRALAQLHPNWSEERELVLTSKDDAPPLDETDPFLRIYEYSEQLLRAWHQMRAPRPSIRALSSGGKAFHEALNNLANECQHSTNRKVCKDYLTEPNQSKPAPTLVSEKD